jgi:hypothetical protein
MEAIEERHVSLPVGLRAGLVHAQGLMHHRVNAGSAGWVRHYRLIVNDHAAELVAAPHDTLQAVNGQAEARIEQSGEDQ